MKTKKKKIINKKSQRCATVYNTLPVKVTRQEFKQYIKPHLSMSNREKPNLSYWKIFNHILFALHTGIQWSNLPVKGCPWTNVYRHHNRWSKDGSYERIFSGSLDYLKRENKLDVQRYRLLSTRALTAKKIRH